MFRALGTWIIHHAPSLRRTAVRTMYNQLSKRLSRDDWTLMNYGYAPLAEDDPSAALDLAAEPERNCLRLYHHVTEPVALGARRLLEVGCGRGGGAAFLARQWQPREVVGVDISTTAIAFCERRHADAGATYRVGDAEKLPFDAGRFDAVINVESSHGYGSPAGFFREVHRVLTPGGVFLFTDFRPADEVESLREQLRAAGLTIRRERDITDNVRLSLEQDTERRWELIRSSAPESLWTYLARFAAVEGTNSYEDFRIGRFRYLSFVLDRQAPAMDDPEQRETD